MSIDKLVSDMVNEKNQRGYSDYKYFGLVPLEAAKSRGKNRGDHAKSGDLQLWTSIPGELYDATRFTG